MIGLGNFNCRASENGFGAVSDYDIIVVGGKRYSANQLLDKQLIAQNPVPIFRASNFTKPYATIGAGKIIGKVYSYIRMDQSSGLLAKSPLLMFYDDGGKAYFVKDDSKINTAFIKEQGGLTVEEETKRDQEEKDKTDNPVMYYLKKYGLPVLLIGGGIYLVGTIGKEVVKAKLTKPALAGAKRK